MILLRFRVYGFPDWTLISCEGEMEESAAIALAGALADDSALHVQARREWTDDWEYIEDFLFSEDV